MNKPNRANYTTQLAYDIALEVFAGWLLSQAINHVAPNLGSAVGDVVGGVADFFSWD